MFCIVMVIHEYFLSLMGILSPVNKHVIDGAHCYSFPLLNVAPLLK